MLFQSVNKLNQPVGKVHQFSCCGLGEIHLCHDCRKGKGGLVLPVKNRNAFALGGVDLSSVELHPVKFKRKHGSRLDRSQGFVSYLLRRVGFAASRHCHRHYCKCKDKENGFHGFGEVGNGGLVLPDNFLPSFGSLIAATTFNIFAVIRYQRLPKTRSLRNF